MPRKAKATAKPSTKARPKPKAKPKGRPKGSPNNPVDHAAGELTRCRCGSTNRTPYAARKERAISGVDREGKPYTHVVWRRTQCTDCRQHRVDRHTEYRPPRKK